ncbi:MAG: class I SAM-dependent methyltransferase [Planctomycetota bacterium]
MSDQSAHPGTFEDDPDLDPDRDAPLDTDEHEAQRRGLLSRLTGSSKRVLDLGCGGGRILLPLAAAGHRVVGLDRDPDALDCLRRRLGAAGLSADLRHGDLATPETWPEGPFDAVVCLGHTFMLLVDERDAVACLRGAGARLGGDGWLALDDLPGMLWPLVAAGDWPAGLAEDGSAQMTWAARDAVFAVRSGDAIDPACGEPGPEDQRCRLWTDGSLRLAAWLAGFSDPEPCPDEGLVLLCRPRSAVASPEG